MNVEYHSRSLRQKLERVAAGATKHTTIRKNKEKEAETFIPASLG
jgi:ribosomal protein L34E